MENDPPDFDGARGLFEQAARLGSPRAASYMGWLYENGHGVAKDDAAAAQWYVRAADGGAHEFALKLAWMYLGRSRLVPDRGLSEYWFTRAIDAGHYPANVAFASVLIADALGGKGVGRVFEARTLLEEALDNGIGVAAFFLARLYVEGIGGHPTDAELGARYARISAEQGEARMQGWLARMYLEGHGLEVDPVEAAFWGGLAAYAGDPLGERVLFEASGLLTDAELESVAERAARWSRNPQAGSR